MCSFDSKIINQTICSIKLSWNNIENCDVFKVEFIQKDVLPERVYWLVHKSLMFTQSVILQ